MLRPTIFPVRITCPECQSEFDVPFALIGPGGRTVRCAQCRHEWHQDGPGGGAPQPVENPYAPPKDPISNTGFEIDFDFGKRPPTEEQVKSFQEMMSDKKPAKPKKVRPPLSSAQRVALIAFGVAGLLSVLLFTVRQPLADMAPPMRRAYLGLGMGVHVPGEGVGIDRLVVQPSWNEKGMSAQVSTRLLNLTDREVTLAPIRIEIVDEKGNAGKGWTFPAPAAKLAAEETVPFTATLNDMPKTKEETLILRARIAP